MFKEFREFAIRGSVVDLAVGIIIGSAFGAVVTSLVNDVIMPPIGLMLGGVDFASLMLVLKEGTKAPPSLRHACGRQGRTRGDRQYRRLHQYTDQLHRRLVRGVSPREGNQLSIGARSRQRRPRPRRRRRKSYWRKSAIC